MKGTGHRHYLSLGSVSDLETEASCSLRFLTIRRVVARHDRLCGRGGIFQRYPADWLDVRFVAALTGARAAYWDAGISNNRSHGPLREQVPSELAQQIDLNGDLPGSQVARNLH